MFTAVPVKTESLEPLLFFVCALSDAKPLHTFAGNALYAGFTGGYLT